MVHAHLPLYEKVLGSSTGVLCSGSHAQCKHRYKHRYMGTSTVPCALQSARNDKMRINSQRNLGAAMEQAAVRLAGPPASCGCYTLCDIIDRCMGQALCICVMLLCTKHSYCATCFSVRCAIGRELTMQNLHLDTMAVYGDDKYVLM